MNPKSNHISSAQNLWDTFLAGQMAKETLLLWIQQCSDLPPTKPLGLTQPQALGFLPGTCQQVHTSELWTSHALCLEGSAYLCDTPGHLKGLSVPTQRGSLTVGTLASPILRTVPLSPQSPAPSTIPCHVRCLFCFSSCEDIKPTGRGVELSIWFTVSVSHSVVSNSL